MVVHSQIRQPGNLPDAPPSKALLASQALRLVPGERHCPECFASFRLSFKYGVYRWCGPRYGDNRCALCDCKEYSATAIGFLHNVKQALWMAKLDCFVMWILEYSRRQILQELHPVRHDTIDHWTKSFQETFSAWFNTKLHDGLDGSLFQSLMRASTSSNSPPSKKRPASASASTKRPSTSMSAKKKPSIAKIHLKAHENRRILIADETHLNKRKPSILAAHGRPQKDQIWLWGAVLQGHVNTHFVFRILDHPDEAHSGKPRGHGEMLKNINILGLRKGDTFVSDGWKATVSAVKAYRRTHRLSQNDLHHEIVNHSEGELVNSHGFTTNPIEAKWSLIKRWIRHRMSGRLPGHSDRHMWRLLIDEYQTRNLLKARNPQIFDRGNIVALRFCEVVPLFRVQ